MEWNGGAEQRHKREPAQLQSDRLSICSSKPPPSTCSFTTRLLELYQECMDMVAGVYELWEVQGRIEKLSFVLKTPPAAPVAVPTPSCQPGRQLASKKRRAQQEAKQSLGREEAYPFSVQPPPTTCSKGEESAAVVAPTTTVIGVATTLAHTVNDTPPASQLNTTLPAPPQNR